MSGILNFAIPAIAGIFFIMVVTLMIIAIIMHFHKSNNTVKGIEYSGDHNMIGIQRSTRQETVKLPGISAAWSPGKYFILQSPSKLVIYGVTSLSKPSKEYALSKTMKDVAVASDIIYLLGTDNILYRMDTSGNLTVDSINVNRIDTDPTATTLIKDSKRCYSSPTQYTDGSDLFCGVDFNGKAFTSTARVKYFVKTGLQDETILMFYPTSK